MQYQYITQFRLEEVPRNFIVYRDIFVFTYTNLLEYVRVEGKGKETEQIIRINPLIQHSPDEMTKIVFDESIQAFIITKGDTSFYMDMKGVYDQQFNKIKWSNPV